MKTRKPHKNCQCGECELLPWSERVAWNNGYSIGIKDGVKGHETKSRKILTDLIADLRSIQDRHCGSTGQTPAAEMQKSVDRAEAALRKVIGDE